MRIAQEDILRKLEGGHCSVYGLNKCINPRVNALYSVNLYQFLTHKHKYLTNVFLDKSDGRYYIGLKEKDGQWSGAELRKVIEEGCKVKVFSYAPVRTKEWEDVTRSWWSEYFSKGANCLDSAKSIH